MIRQYAIFSNQFPNLHRLFIVLIVSISLMSSYLVLEHNHLQYAWGIILPVLPFALFAKSSDYKKKYMHTEK
ncbi:hypothetical protein VV869_14110 [Photobacterium sp. MCCC 1A19761]|uniref:hypothetical protein n=1 Tax=Photobacterium sp. MCCC 1A19761 TaxID=3115000 RepID=UPI00307F3892